MCKSLLIFEYGTDIGGGAIIRILLAFLLQDRGAQFIAQLLGRFGSAIRLNLGNSILLKNIERCLVGWRTRSADRDVLIGEFERLVSAITNPTTVSRAKAPIVDDEKPIPRAFLFEGPRVTLALTLAVLD